MAMVMRVVARKATIEELVEIFYSLGIVLLVAERVLAFESGDSSFSPLPVCNA